MRPRTHESRRRLYLMARVVIARHYRQPLTLARVARALASSPRQVQRAFEQFGGASFSEHLMQRRLSVAADVLLQQRPIPVADVARLVGYRQGSHFARAFRRRYGISPREFRGRGAEALGGEALGGSALGGSAVGGSAVGGSALGGEALGGEALGEPAGGGVALGVCREAA